MSEYLLILLSTILVNNYVLVRFLGLCPFMGVSNKLESAIGMSAATTFVLTLASAASYLTNTYVLAPLDLEYLQTISFILVIAVTVQFTEMFVRKASPLLHRVLGVFLPLITSNCAVLGVALLNVRIAEQTFLKSVVYGFGAAMGFSLVLVLFAAMRERITVSDVPEPFQGPSIALITAGLMSLAFMGFSRAGAILMTITISTAIFVLMGFAIVFGAILGLAGIKFKVDGDPIIDQIDSVLPQTQCGQCGHPGCRPYAEAIAEGEDHNHCPPGGEDVIQQLSDLLGRDFIPLDEEHGEASDIPNVAYIREDECIGCTKCIQACPVDAILGAAKQMHTVIADECTGCDLCVEPCPVDCIDMLPVPTTQGNWVWPKPAGAANLSSTLIPVENIA